jgi:hypothetical protein
MRWSPSVKSIALFTLFFVHIDAATGPSKEIWIAVRLDGRRGSGTSTNPFDGSTQEKFDRVMNAVMPGTHVHILPGVYESKGDEGWQPKDNEWIQGSGMGVTILRRVGVTGLEFSRQPAVIGGGDGSQRNHIRVSDLTLDCNAAAIPSKSISRALGLSCVYAKIENIEAKNFGHYQTGAEMFGFGVASSVPGKHWVEIHNCYLHDYISRGDRCTIRLSNPVTVTIDGNVTDQYPEHAQVVFSQLTCSFSGIISAVAANISSVDYANGHTTLTFSVGTVSDCTAAVVTPTRGATLIYALGIGGATWRGIMSGNYIYMPGQIPAAFGDAGWDGMLVENNAVYGGSLFTFDTYNSDNVTFKNNILHTGTPAGGYIGLVGGGYRWKNWRITNNEFYIQPVMNQGIVINDNVIDTEINDNWFFLEGDISSMGDIPILNLLGSRITLKRNHFDPALRVHFVGRSSIARDNTYLDGTIVRAIVGNRSSR